MIPYNEKLKTLSRNLRKNMTDAERLLWSRLKSRKLYGVQFYRQRILGDYIVDFYCPTSKLVIELDGSQHYTKVGQHKDEIRTQFLKKFGLVILRFSDNEVFENLDGVIEEIVQRMKRPNEELKIREKSLI